MLTTAQAAAGVFVTAATVRRWASDGRLQPAARDWRGRPLYAWRDVIGVEHATRSTGRGRPRNQVA